jgi:hypothetical protein
LIDWSPAAFLLMTLAPAAGEPSPADPMQFAQVMIREQILIRVPARVRNMVSPPPPAPIEWKEGRGVKCVGMGDIVGGALVSQDSFDLLLRDRTRVRAKLDKSCPALDYYYGFYIRQTADGKICADRDSIRSRMGGQCEIDRFRTLKAAKRD